MMPIETETYIEYTTAEVEELIARAGAEGRDDEARILRSLLDLNVEVGNETLRENKNPVDL